MSRCLNFSFLSKDKSDEDEVGIEHLPDELLINIFKLLTLEEMLQCENVCRRWRGLVRDRSLWRHVPVVCSGQLGEISERNLEIINMHGKRVHWLKMQYVLNYRFIEKIIRQCTNLVAIELLMCRLEKEFEVEIKNWPNLTRLNMKNSLLKSSTNLIIQYDEFKNLNFLGLSDFGLNSENCDSLLRCNALQHILIDKIRGLSLEYIKSLITVKKDMLITLQLYGGNAVDDDCLFLLAQCPKLENLAIYRCEQLTDRALVGVASLLHLSNLQLWNNDVFSEAMLMKTLTLPNLIKLRRLSLSRILNISPVIVDVIAEYYKNLKFLALYQCPKIINTDYEKQLKPKFRNIEIVLY